MVTTKFTELGAYIPHIQKIKLSLVVTLSAVQPLLGRGLCIPRLVLMAARLAQKHVTLAKEVNGKVAGL